MIWNAIFYLLSECTISVDENSNFAIWNCHSPIFLPSMQLQRQQGHTYSPAPLFRKRELKDSTIQDVGHSFHALFIVAKQCVTLFTPGLCDSDSDSGSGALWCRVLIKLENSSSRSKRAARRAIQRGKVKTETHKQRQARRLLVKEEETLVKADFYLLTNCCRCSVDTFCHSLEHSQSLFYFVTQILTVKLAGLPLPAIWASTTRRWHYFLPPDALWWPNGWVQFIKTWIATGLAGRLLQTGSRRQEDDGSDPPHCSLFQQ